MYFARVRIVQYSTCVRKFKKICRTQLGLWIVSIMTGKKKLRPKKLHSKMSYPYAMWLLNKPKFKPWAQSSQYRNTAVHNSLLLKKHVCDGINSIVFIPSGYRIFIQYGIYSKEFYITSYKVKWKFRTVMTTVKSYIDLVLILTLCLV